MTRGGSLGFIGHPKSSGRPGGLFVGVVVLNLGNVYISVCINHWNKSFYSALQAFDSSELLRQLGVFCVLVASLSRYLPTRFISTRCCRSTGAAG